MKDVVDVKILGERIKLLREQRGLRQIDLADTFGVTGSAVTQWETDKRDPDLETIRRLASFFQVTVAYLIGSTEEKSADHELPADWLKVFRSAVQHNVNADDVQLMVQLMVQVKGNEKREG